MKAGRVIGGDEHDPRTHATQLVDEARAGAERLLEAARPHAAHLRSDVKALADNILGDARAEAERLHARATAEATRLRDDARALANQLVGRARRPTSNDDPGDTDRGPTASPVAAPGKVEEVV